MDLHQTLVLITITAVRTVITVKTFAECFVTEQLLAVLRRVEHIVILTIFVQEEDQAQNRLVQAIEILDLGNHLGAQRRNVIPVDADLVLLDRVCKRLLVKTFHALNRSALGLECLFNRGGKRLAITLDFARIEDENRFVLSQRRTPYVSALFLSACQQLQAFIALLTPSSMAFNTISTDTGTIDDSSNSRSTEVQLANT